MPFLPARSMIRRSPRGSPGYAQLAADHEIVWLTGRPEWLRAVTVAWFGQHGLPGGRLDHAAGT